MQNRTYAVFWDEVSGHRFAGRLAVRPGYAELGGGGENGVKSHLRILFEDIVAVRYGRGLLQIRRRGHSPLEIGSVDGPGALHEAAERLQSFTVPA